MDNLRITLLVDHTAASMELETEHGLSLLIETGEEAILFDAGSSDAAFRNAKRLGLPWRSVTRIVLSHGHRDHTGGLHPWLEALPEARIYLHPRALSPKWVRHPGKPPRELTTPEEVQRQLWTRRDLLHLAAAPMRLTRGIGLTGPIPRRHPEESASAPFFLDAEGREPDPLEDDLALWIPTERGLVVVLGCAHAGLANTLGYIQTISGEGRFAAIIGGLHLGSASPERLAFSRQVLERLRPDQLIPLHCTGSIASDALQDAFPQTWKRLLVGDTLTIP